MTHKQIVRKFKAAQTEKVKETNGKKCGCMLLTEYVPAKTTITKVYYSQVLDRAHNTIKEKDRGKSSKNILQVASEAP